MRWQGAILLGERVDYGVIPAVEFISRNSCKIIHKSYRGGWILELFSMGIDPNQLSRKGKSGPFAGGRSGDTELRAISLLERGRDPRLGLCPINECSILPCRYGRWVEWVCSAARSFRTEIRNPGHVSRIPVLLFARPAYVGSRPIRRTNCERSEHMGGASGVRHHQAL